jgi:hypothetical protein
VITVLHWCFSPSVSEKPGGKDTDLPTQTNNGGGKLICDGASMYEILSTLRRLGKDVVDVEVNRCNPQVKVNLNQSCFEGNTNLKTLLMSSCGIVNIEPSTFKPLGN